MLDQQVTLGSTPKERSIVPFVDAPALRHVLVALAVALVASAGSVAGIELLGL